MEVGMTEQQLVARAAGAAIHQRQHGDSRSLRALFLDSFSLLRFLHHQWRRPGTPCWVPGAR